MVLIVEGMTCVHCIRSITRAIEHIDPTAKVGVDLAREEVSIEGHLEPAVIVAAIQDAGYGVVAILERDPAADESCSHPQGDQLIPAPGCCGTCQP